MSGKLLGMNGLHLFSIGSNWSESVTLLGKKIGVIDRLGRGGNRGGGAGRGVVYIVGQTWSPSISKFPRPD